MNTKITLLFSALLFTCVQLTAQEKLIWSDFGQSGLFISNLDGTDVQEFITSNSSTNSPGFEIDQTNKLIFWINGKQILKSSYSNFSASTGIEIYSNSEAIITDLALDIDNQKIYWSEITEDEILRSDYSGGNIEIVYTDIAINPYALEFWPEKNQLIYGRQGGVIGKINANNLLREEIFEADYIVSDIEIDYENNNIYFTNQNTIQNLSSIEKIDVEGNNHEVLASDQGNTFGLAISASQNKLFWTDWANNYFDISSIKLDGTELEPLIQLDNMTPYALEIITLTSTKVKEFSDHNKLTIAPNPTLGYFTIHSDENYDFLIIKNQLGKTIYETSNFNNSHQLDCPAGVYYVQTFKNGSPMRSSKLIKQ